MDPNSQESIKKAVTASASNEEQSQSQEGYEGMQPSLLQPQDPDQTAPPVPAPEQYPEQQYSQQDYSQYGEQYPQYQQYQPAGLSSDTITEIAEQVVAEKLSSIRKDLERVIDMKSSFEAKMEYLDERLRRIEKIIDRLEISILQKVGEYITNIDDIKKEMIETQKSIKSLAHHRK